MPKCKKCGAEMVQEENVCCISNEIRHYPINAYKCFNCGSLKGEIQQNVCMDKTEDQDMAK
jgi:hypothetical protein